MPEKPSDPPGITAQRDVVMGNQINYNLADLSAVEALLEQILELLRQPTTSLKVTGPTRRSGCILIVDEQGHETEIPPELTSALGLLQRSAAPQRREEIYLARFTLDHLYAQWERTYLPLEGILNLEPSLRLTDASDQSLSAAGTKIADLRYALTELDKTRLVILGEPGAGKTTTLERLALDLARQRLRDPLQGKLPIRIDLYKFTDQRNPSDFLSSEWQYTGLTESYGEAIARGQVCFLLDGVNQMPMEDRNRRIEKWAHWANSHVDLPEGNWAVFTCRAADYTASLRLPEVHVQTLDSEHMRRYFELRFGPEQAARHWGEFERRLISGDHRFERLARNPFMLSLLTDNVAEGQGLTDNRARLMDNLAQRLLRHELEEGRQPPALTADPLGTLTAMLQALNRLGFAMQHNRGEGTLLKQAEAQRVKLFDRQDMRLSLDEVLHLALDSHVLEKTIIERNSKKEAGYVFYHHLLQEYFAARRLLELFRGGKRLGKYLRVRWRWWQFRPRRLRLGEPLPQPPVTGWEETVLMAASLSGKDAPAFARMVERHNLSLAGRCLAAADPQRADLQAQAHATRQSLLERQRSHAAHLRARIAAGLALGELGHPELQPKQVESEGRSVWVIFPPLQSVPEGGYLFGSDPTDPQAYKDELTTQRQQTLPAFHIGRYAVTNAEYRYFIEAGGYQEERWWSVEGLKWKQGGPDAHATAMEDWLNIRTFYQSQDLMQYARKWGWRPQTLRFWQRMVKLSNEEASHQAQKQFERSFDRPAFWDDPDLSSPARSVVGVNWYEAEAYCRWLSQVTGRTFRLPSEMEWEKAARGVDGRAYPWGERFDPRRCNSQESHIFETTPVGLYPDGQSPYGIHDASGNVWEWTASWYQAYFGSQAESKDFGERFRVVRGGSWNLYRRIVRCACRLGDSPAYFNGSLGFRVLSPG